MSSDSSKNSASSKSHNTNADSCSATILSKLSYIVSLVRSHHPRRHSPQKRFRKRVMASVLLILTLTVFSLLTYNLVGDRFNSHIKNAFEQITGGEIEIGKASINILNDIRIQDVKVYLPDQQHDQSHLIFSADDIIMTYNPFSLLTRSLEVKKIVAAGALLRLTYDNDSSEWILTKLKLNLPKSSGKSTSPASFPQFIIRDSIIQYQSISNKQHSLPVSQKFSGYIARDLQDNLIYFDFYSDAKTLLPDCSIKGSFDPDEKELVSNFQFDMENFTSENLPPNLTAFKNLYDQINPRGKIKLKSLYSQSKGNTVTVLFENASAGMKVADTIVPLPDISGEIICSDTETRINSVSVKYTDAEFNVSGSVQGYAKDSPIDLHLSSKGFTLADDQWQNFDILKSTRNDTEDLAKYSQEARSTGSFKPVLKILVSVMPLENKKIFWELLPTGLFDLDFSFNRTEGKNDVSADIQLVEAGGRFHKFPYPVKGASGPISIRPGHVSFGPITASEEDQHVEINGSAVKNDQNKWDIVTDVEVKNVKVTDKLYSAFDKIQKDVFDMFSPQGRANAVYHIDVTQGSPPRDKLDINFKDCSGTFKYFPLPLTECYGQVHWNRQSTNFVLDHGKTFAGTVSASGQVNMNQETGDTLQCSVDFKDINLQPELVNCLPDNIKKTCLLISPTGIVSGTASLSKIFEDGIQNFYQNNKQLTSVKHDIALDLKDGSIIYDKLPVPIQNINASIAVKDEVVSLESFNGFCTNNPPLQSQMTRLSTTETADTTSPISVTGKILPDGYNLNINCKSFYLSSEIEQFINDTNPEIWEKYRPSGSANLEILVQKVQDNDQDFYCKLSPVNMNAQFQGYPLEKLGGAIIFTPDTISFDNFSIAGDQININGKINSLNNSPAFDLSVETTNLQIDERLKAAFKEQVPLLQDSFNLTGKLTSNLKIASYSNNQQSSNITKPLWNISGPIKIIDGSGNFKLPASQINADLSINLQFEPEDKNITAATRLIDLNCLVMDRPLNNTSADISYDSISKQLDIIIDQATLCNGLADGEIHITLDNNNNTSFKFALENSDLRMLTNANGDNNINGYLSGYLNLSAQDTSKLGSFDFQVTDGSLGKLPIIVEILNLINITNQHAGAFNKASIKGDFRDNQTFFSKVNFKGSSVEITGTGTMVGPFETEQANNGLLDLTFMVEAPDIIKPIPVIGSLFNAVRRGIIYVKAIGPYNDPEIEPVTLSVIGDLFNDYIGISQKPAPVPSTK